MNTLVTAFLTIALVIAAFGAGAYTAYPKESPLATETPATGEPLDENVSKSWQTFNETFQVVIVKEIPRTDMQSDANCVMMASWIGGKPVKQTIRNGSVAVSWNANNALAETLHLGILRSHDFQYREHSGRQSIVAPFGTDGQPMGYSFSFSVESTVEEFPYGEAVDVTLQFEVLTDGVVKFNPKAKCDIVPDITMPETPSV